MFFPTILCILYVANSEALDVDEECGKIRYGGPDLPADFHVSNGISGPFYFKMTEKDVKKTDYQFVAAPTDLLLSLDPYCFTAICLMIYKESYWKSQNRTFNGYFTLSVDEFAAYLHIKNKKDARLTLEALYRAGLIDIKAQDGIRLAAKVKLNWDRIKDWDLSLVERLPRTEHTSYSTTPEREQKGAELGTGVGTAWGTSCTPTLELEQELELDIEQEKDKERELKQEPSAIETFPMTIEEYLQSFIDRYPYINYSYSPDKFYDTYFQELTGLQTQIDEDSGIAFTIRDLAASVYFFKTTGKLPGYA